jgi:AraC-like DNA-binding protein
MPTMKLLADIAPYVRMAHPWLYHNHPGEGRRVGYTFAFHLFTEGRGCVMIGDSCYEVDKRKLILIRPGVIHSFHYRPETPLQSYNIYCDFWSRPEPSAPHLAFAPDRFDPGLLTKTEECRELDMLPTLSSLASLPYLQELLNQVVQATQARHYATQLAGSLMYAFILRWFNSVCQPPAADKRIRKIVEQIETHPERSPAVEEWCRLCALEKSHFFKLFRKHTGMTPKQYLLQVKMRKAAALLRDSNETMTAVAEQLGYASVHYFSRQFAGYYGVSPSQFRFR